MIIFFKKKLHIWPISVILGALTLFWTKRKSQRITLKIPIRSKLLDKLILYSTENDWDIQFKESLDSTCHIEVSGQFSQQQIETINSAKVEKNTFKLDLSDTTKKLFFTFFHLKCFKPYSFVVFLPKDMNPPLLEINTSRGDLNISAVLSASMSIISKTGDIEIQKCDFKKLSIAASSGDVKIAETDIQDCNISTKSGDIIITLPQNFSGTIKTASHIGDIKVPNYKESTPPQSTLTLSTTIGDIIIKNPLL